MDVLEAPPVKPAGPKPFAPGAMSGKSPADVFNEQAAEVDPPSDFSAGLKAAQANDKAPVAPAPAPDPAPSPKDIAPPKVPGLPSAPAPAPADEWKPQGKAAAHWDAMKAKHAEEVAAIKAEAERVKTELAAAKASGSPDVEELRKERDKYRELLRDVAIERDPEFRQTYAARESAAIDAAKLAAGEHATKLESLLKAPSSQWRDEQINAILEELPQSSQRRVNAALGVLDQIDVQRTSEIAQRRATFDQKQSALRQNQTVQQQEQSKQATVAFEEMQGEWMQKLAPLIVPKDAPKDDPTIPQSVALAREIMSGQLTPKDLARAAFWAASGEALLKSLQAERTARQAAESALDKMRGVQPGDGKAGGLNQEEDNVPAPGTTEYLRYAAAKLKEAQSRDAMSRAGRK